MKKVKIEDIDRGMIDEEVCIDAVVTDIASSHSKSSYFLTINDGTGQMTLIVFEKQLAEIQSNSLDIHDFKDRKVEATGKITEYNSDLEIILSGGDGLKIIK